MIMMGSILLYTDIVSKAHYLHQPDAVVGKSKVTYRVAGEM